MDTATNQDSSSGANAAGDAPAHDSLASTSSETSAAGTSEVAGAGADAQQESSTPEVSEGTMHSSEISETPGTPALPDLTMPGKVEEVLGKIGASAGKPDAKPVVLGIAVVDFNHLVGPRVEYAHPKELADDEELCESLPFLALPDGSHLSEEDYCYFHLLCPNLSPRTIFGISCNRQIASDALLKKGAEVTRSTVQKAVVVLAREPVFGPIREKLGIVTRAFFAQGDLADVDLLVDFHATLEAGLHSGGFAEDSDAVMYMGTSLRELVYKWRFKTLMLLKLLLLQRRTMFCGYPIEQLCTYQYSLVSLIPGLLLSLQDSGSPTMDKIGSKRAMPESLRTSDRKSFMRYMGLPIHIFGEDAFFQPYLPLQQILMLKASSWLVGTSNSIFRQQKDCAIDVIVDLEHSTIEFLDQKLQHCVNLTAADRKWMDELVHVVTETWNAADPSRPTSMQYVGSDDWLRTKFEDYICAALASIKHDDFVAKNDKESVSIAGSEMHSSNNYNAEWVAAFKKTKGYELWNATTDPMLFDICDPKHPCEGKVSALEDVGLRLSAGLHDLRIEENLGPTRDAIGTALQAGGANIYRLASNFRNDLVRLRTASADGTRASATSSHESPRGSVDAGGASGRASPSGVGLGPAASAGQFIPAPAVAAASQAGTQVRAALGSFGSFLSTKQKQWGGARSSSGSGSVTPNTEVTPASAPQTDPQTASSTPASSATYPPS